MMHMSYRFFFSLHNRTRHVTIHHHPCRGPVLKLQTACALNGVMFYGPLQWRPLSVCRWPFQSDAVSSTLAFFFFFSHSYWLMEFSFDLYSNWIASDTRSSAAAISHSGESRKCPYVTHPRWKTGMIMVSGSVITAHPSGGDYIGTAIHGSRTSVTWMGLHVSECARANQVMPIVMWQVRHRDYDSNDALHPEEHSSDVSWGTFTFWWPNEPTNHQVYHDFWVVSPTSLHTI